VEPGHEPPRSETKMTNPVYYRICQALKRARVDAGWSESDLAERIEQTAEFVREYESCSRTLLVDELLRVADTLALQPSRLLEGVASSENDGHRPPHS
jgi:ribosome-binding protein aMBF1 (putative translation factor)